MVCCRKGDAFQGPKLDSCLTLGNELSKETHVLTKQEILLWEKQNEILLGKGHPGGEQEGKGTQENCSAIWLTVLGFMVMRLVSGLSRHLIQNPSWWRMHCSAKMDTSEKDSGRWLDTWCHLLTFPELFQLVVAY